MIRGLDGQVHDYAEYEEQVKPRLKKQMSKEYHSQEKQDMWYESKTDIIIPTWNSMPELETTLRSIYKCIPDEYRDRIIIVDKDSEDQTKKCAQEYNCDVVIDKGTLGSARLTGLHHAKSEWVLFIDSDIEIDKPWFNGMHTISIYLNETKYNPGWIYGRTLDDIPLLHEAKNWKCWLDFKHDHYRLIPGRAYTHNSFCVRKPLLSAPIQNVNAWEDSVMADTMREAGFDVFEVFNTCIQHRGSTYEKNGIYTEAWSQMGLLQVQGVNLYTLLRPFWFPWWGMRCGLHFHNMDHVWYNLKVFKSIIHGCINKNQYNELCREVKQDACRNDHTTVST